MKACKKRSVDGWMKGFDPAIENLRVLCNVRNEGDGKACFLERSSRASRRKEFKTKRVQRCCERYDTGFVVHAEECPGRRRNGGHGLNPLSQLPRPMHLNIAPGGC